MRNDTLGRPLTPGGEHGLFVRRQLRSHRFGKRPVRCAKAEPASLAPENHALFGEGVQQFGRVAHNTPSSNSLLDESIVGVASKGCAAMSRSIIQSVSSRRVGLWMRRPIATLTLRSASI